MCITSLRLNNILFVWAYHLLFLHLPIGGHLAVASNTAVNMVSLLRGN